MPVNSNQRNSSGKNIVVETISLNEVIQKYFDGICPSYISVDTEGSEFEILKGLEDKIKDVGIIYFEHHYDLMLKIRSKIQSKIKYISGIIMMKIKLKTRYFEKLQRFWHFQDFLHK